MKITYIHAGLFEQLFMECIYMHVDMYVVLYSMLDVVSLSYCRETRRAKTYFKAVVGNVIRKRG